MKKANPELFLFKSQWFLSILWMVLITFSHSGNASAQNKEVTIQIINGEISDVLMEIQLQTGINYLFNHEETRGVSKVTVNIEKGSIEEALDMCFKNTSLTYVIKNNMIIVKPKQSTPNKEIQQSLLQTLKGNVIDAESGNPLTGANVLVLETSPLKGSTTDKQGDFRIEGIPVGRYDIQVSYIGYESEIVNELLIGTGKESVINVTLKESVARLDEVTVNFAQKGLASNSMASISSRSFSVEEASRYAGGFDDPARLAASFAGITTENSRDNTIIIRGNSPKGLLWRLEGVEIPNPNHFANLSTFGGGGISALSALVVGNSDFYTGAFPAEFGNATSGVFDIKLRSGNNEKHEHAMQIGTMGVDLSSEGPLGKGSRASYLFNYRYSTMGLIKEIFPEDLKKFIPVYQDLCFKINIPTKKSGTFSFWGLASHDFSTFPAMEDTSKWEITMDRMDNRVIQNIGGLGFNHRYLIQNNSWLSTSLAITGDYMDYKDDFLDYDLTHYEYNYLNVRNFKYTFTSVYNHKFSAKHSNRTGIIVDNLHYDIDLKYAPIYNQGLISIADEKNASTIVQLFSQSKFNITEKFLLNAGLHGLYFNLNNEIVAEPRLCLTYSLGKSQSISFAYGNHSRIEPLSMYFAKVNNGNAIDQPNKDLKVSKAHHFVLSFDKILNSNLRFKIEPYFQYLYDVPVIPDSNYSVLNMEAEWYSFNKELVNRGTGKNMGIDITLERYLNKGYYYLFTASFFDSKYKGDDGIEHNTRFNTGYIINLLYGKEWILGKQKNKILGVNAKVNFSGGKRTTPVNQEQSAIVEDVVYYYSRLFEEKEHSRFYVNATINYRINKKKHASIWSLQMMNIFVIKENYGYFYNYRSKQVEPWELAVPTPSLSYKIEF